MMMYMARSLNQQLEAFKNSVSLLWII
jgi:hypothetical protein